MPKDPSSGSVDHSWNGLYRTGGAAALIAVAIVAIEAVVASWSPPTTAIGWFTLFQNNRLLGLLDHGILDVGVSALLVPMFVAIYVALRGAKKTWVAVATPLALAGIAAYWATNQSFNLLFLSDRYAAATTDAQRSQFLASAQAISTIDQNGMFYSMGFVLVVVASLIVSIAMLRSNVFGKATASVGILSSLLTLSFDLSWTFVPTTNIVPVVIAGGGAILMFIWWALIGQRLYRLGRLEVKIIPQSS